MITIMFIFITMRSLILDKHTTYFFYINVPTYNAMAIYM